MIKYFFTTTQDKNIAFHVNDNINDVKQNRLNLGANYGVNMNNLRYMNQVHGCHIEVVTKKSKLCLDDCDALITNEPNTPLMVMVADCIPILLYDEKKSVIAAVHAGRNGSFLSIVEKTALKMCKVFNCKVEDMTVVLGPSIQRCCYEVSQEMANTVKNKFGKCYTNGRLIDLQGINKKQLLDFGILGENIDISSVCTKCSNKNYYSYRLNNHCGRFAGVISLP